MPRNRRSVPSTQPSEPLRARSVGSTNPTAITKEVTRVAVIILLLLLILAGLAYWQQQSPTLNNWGARLQTFLAL